MKKQPSEFQSHQRFKIKKVISFKKYRTFLNNDLKSILKMTTLRAFLQRCRRCTGSEVQQRCRCMSSGEVGQVQIEEQVQRGCRCCCEMQVQRWRVEVQRSLRCRCRDEMCRDGGKAVEQR